MFDVREVNDASLAGPISDTVGTFMREKPRPTRSKNGALMCFGVRLPFTIRHNISALGRDKERNDVMITITATIRSNSRSSRAIRLTSVGSDEVHRPLPSSARVAQGM
jgi:hypothetical protein